MKVVLFCGGEGTRMRESVPHRSPKPMAMIGERPLLWHLMRFYAHHGHTDFILCLGYGAEEIKDYFLDYRETTSNDFVLSEGGARVELLSTDISTWRISFVDTGLDSSIGERLRRVRRHLDGEPVFLANYGDVLTDVDLDLLLKARAERDSAALVLAVRPTDSFHALAIDSDDRVAGVRAAGDLDLWINGGYLVLTQEVFDHLEPGEDLIGDAFPRLARRGRLSAYRHTGYWAAADTVKDRLRLEALHRSGRPPWQVWRTGEEEPHERRQGERRAALRER
jgi:glucose-1-phosphate cytidylyltransferase